jgi:hypothetical protein
MRILQITTIGGLTYIVDSMEDMTKLEKIVYFKHAYNTGSQGDFPCYVAYYSDASRMIIPLTRVEVIRVDSTKTEKEDNKDPEADIGLGKAEKKESDIESGNDNANEQEEVSYSEKS